MKTKLNLKFFKNNNLHVTVLYAQVCEETKVTKNGRTAI